MTKASSFTSRPRFCPQHHAAGEKDVKRYFRDQRSHTSAACSSELIISTHLVPTHGATSEAQREVTTSKQPLLRISSTAKD